MVYRPASAVPVRPVTAQEEKTAQPVGAEMRAAAREEGLGRAFYSDESRGRTHRSRRLLFGVVS